MIEKNGIANYTLGCDGCYEQAEEAFGTWDGAKQYAKENNWKSKKICGEWFIFCPECFEETKKNEIF